METPQHPGRKAVLVGLLAAAIALLWQVTLVYGLYERDWTGLFFAGDRWPPPPSVIPKPRLQPNSQGYDGQFSLYVAHDPAMLEETPRYLDNAVLRYRRILLPAIAFLAALGRSAWIVPAYVGVVLAFLFLATWALSRFCLEHGYRAIYGLAALLLPAVAVSLDRMTTDVALAAFCMVFCWAASIGCGPALYASLVLAPLTRETGFALTAGYLAFTILRRDAEAIVFTALSALPAAAWFSFVESRLPVDRTPWLSLIPFRGIVGRAVHPVVYPTTTLWLKVAAGFDYIGVLGVALAFILTLAFLLRGDRHIFLLCAVAFTGGVAFVAKSDVWEQAYSFSRTMSPLLLLLALRGLETRRWILLAPVLMNVPRIALQYEAEIRAILRRI